MKRKRLFCGYGVLVPLMDSSICFDIMLSPPNSTSRSSRLKVEFFLKSTKSLALSNGNLSFTSLKFSVAFSTLTTESRLVKRF